MSQCPVLGYFQRHFLKFLLNIISPSQLGDVKNIHLPSPSKAIRSLTCFSWQKKTLGIMRLWLRPFGELLRKKDTYTFIFCDHIYIYIYYISIYIYNIYIYNIYIYYNINIYIYMIWYLLIASPKMGANHLDPCHASGNIIIIFSSGSSWMSTAVFQP